MDSSPHVVDHMVLYTRKVLNRTHQTRPPTRTSSRAQHPACAHEQGMLFERARASTPEQQSTMAKSTASATVKIGLACHTPHDSTGSNPCALFVYVIRIRHMPFERVSISRSFHHNAAVIWTSTSIEGLASLDSTVARTGFSEPTHSFHARFIPAKSRSISFNHT